MIDADFYSGAVANNRGKILFVAHWDWVLYNYRLPIARALRDRGLDVVFVCPRGRYVDALQGEGFDWREWKLDRGGFNPLRELKGVLGLISIYRKLAPFAVHHFTIKPNLYGSLAGFLTGVPRTINTFTGLGYTFSASWKATLVRAVIGPLARLLFRRSDHWTVVQTPYDREVLLKQKWAHSQRTRVIVGSGVDLSRFFPQPNSASSPSVPVVLFAGRLVRDKGVLEFAEAARRLRRSSVHAEFCIAGEPDKGNPRSIDVTQLETLRRDDAVQLLGHRTDMPELLRRASIAVLPTQYNEGVPLFLLEAAATGVPLVATDTPGCREVVTHGVNGYLIPGGDVAALTESIERLLLDDDLRLRFARESRRIAKERFAIERIVQDYLAFYRDAGIME